MQPDRDASRLPFWPFLACVALVLIWCIGQLGGRDGSLCEACPGHRELASECLCYHVPPTPESLPH